MVETPYRSPEVTEPPAEKRPWLGLAGVLVGGVTAVAGFAVSLGVSNPNDWAGNLILCGVVICFVSFLWIAAFWKLRYRLMLIAAAVLIYATYMAFFFLSVFGTLRV